MPWCEKCKFEYEDNVKRCSDCGELLVDHLVDHLEESQSSVENNNSEYVFLKNVANTIEADIMISILESENISSIKKFESSGSYLNIASGYNYQGVNIFVPKAALHEAKNIILVDSMVDQTQEQIQEQTQELTQEQMQELQENKDFDKLAKDYSDKRKNNVRTIIMIIVIIPIVISLLYNLSNLFESL